MEEGFDDTPFSIKTDINPALAPGGGTDLLGGDRPFSVESDETCPWFLGLDIGTTGISAVLLNRVTRTLFPIYWHTTGSASSGSASLESASFNPGNPDGEKGRWFRLPAVVSGDRPTHPTSFQPSGHRVSISFGQGQSSGQEQPALEIHHIKPYLALGIPYFYDSSLSDETGADGTIVGHHRHWEPLVQWSTTKAFPLHWFQQAVQALAATLTQSASADSWQMEVASTVPAEPNSPALACSAVGLGDEQLQSALRQLGGVVVGCPSDWPDSYGVNLREALIKTRLIAHSTQLAIVPEAIAVILSGLRYPDGDVLRSPDQSAPPPFTQNSATGAILAISAGATATDLALLPSLPEHQSLLQEAFHLQSLAFGGDALDQDIISQLVLPLVRRDAGMAETAEHRPQGASHHEALRLSMELSDWRAIAVTDWPSPPAGHPALADRIRFQQTLHDSSAGQRLLTLAQTLKIGLQHYEQCHLAVGDQDYRIYRRDLGTLVFVPFLETLKQSVLHLLQTASIAEDDIQKVICSGGTASLRVIALWLRKRFPNATIIQDNYGKDNSGKDIPGRSDGQGDRHALPVQNNQCSRVAYGLATLPLHPRLFTEGKATDDYEVLSALLDAMPKEPLAVDAILQQLASRGMGGEPSVDRLTEKIVRLLNGYFPPGIKVGLDIDTWIAAGSRKALLSHSTCLFEQPAPNLYRLNHQSKALVQQRLTQLRQALHPNLIYP